MLPASAESLQASWDTHPSSPTGARGARWAMIEFLAANKIEGQAIEEEVYATSFVQWCSPEPRRCKGFHPAPGAPVLPWARALWESSNRELRDGLTDQEAHDALMGIVEALTTAISGPEGCPRCADHWAQRLTTVPVPPTLTLDEARHWLVDAHNFTREGKTPTAFETVAIQFNWTSN